MENKFAGAHAPGSYQEDMNMKPPCCGKEMVMDAHTKIDKFMCYDCGYVEGRPVPATRLGKRIYRHKFVRSYSMNDAMAFITKGLGLGKSSLASSHR